MPSLRTLSHTSKTLVMLWLCHFIVDVMIGFWAVYKTLAKLDLAMAGLIASVSPFIGEGMQVIFGSLGDRGYRKALLVFGVMACSVSVLLPYTESYIALFAIYLMTCIGSGAFHPSAAALASGFSDTRKGLFVSLFACGGAVGMAVSHIIFTLWHHHFDKNIFILLIPVFLLVGALLFSEFPATNIREVASNKSSFKEFLRLFRSPQLLSLYGTQVCNQAIFWGIIFLLPDVLLSKGYEPWICFGGGHFCFIIGGAVMMIPAGMISDVYSPKSVLFFATFGGLLLFYTFILSPVLADFAILPLLFGLGAALGVCSPVVIAFGNRILPNRPGLISAFLMGVAWCVSESIGPGGGGLLTKCFDENAPVKALACFGFLFVAGMMATFCLSSEVKEEQGILEL